MTLSRRGHLAPSGRQLAAAGLALLVPTVALAHGEVVITLSLFLMGQCLAVAAAIVLAFRRGVGWMTRTNAVLVVGLVCAIPYLAVGACGPASTAAGPAPDAVRWLDSLLVTWPGFVGGFIVGFVPPLVAAALFLRMARRRSITAA